MFMILFGTYLSDILRLKYILIIELVLLVEFVEVFKGEIIEDVILKIDNVLVLELVM